jgi:PAS domain-containing protein
MSCAMISGVCEAMHRARTRAVQAEVKARFAEERRRIEDDRLKSEERLRMALDAANSGTWEWDLRTNENFWFTVATLPGK